jgi:hypothetical protein
MNLTIQKNPTTIDLHEEYHCKAYNYITKTQNIRGMK